MMETIVGKPKKTIALKTESIISPEVFNAVQDQIKSAASPVPPRGYKYDENGAIVIDESEAKIIVKAFEKFSKE